jgi:hypothetical protein
LPEHPHEIRQNRLLDRRHLGLYHPHATLFHLRQHRPPGPSAHHPSRLLLGFVAVALAWQVGFVVIARDPVRLRLMMIPAVLEKFGYGISLIVLYLQHRLHGVDVAFGGIDLLLGLLFLVAFARTGS